MPVELAEFVYFDSVECLPFYYCQGYYRSGGGGYTRAVIEDGWGREQFLGISRLYLRQGNILQIWDGKFLESCG
jgi:hypothetical protein